MDKKGRFHETPVQLVQNVHRLDSCPIGQVVLHSSAFCPYSTKAKNMVKSMVSVIFASLCTKDLELRWASPWSNFKHYPQITKFLLSTLRMCIAVPRALYCCLKSNLCHTLLPYEYSSGKQNTRNIAWFRCYLNLCVHWTWNQKMLLIDRSVPKFMHYAQETKFCWHKSLTCPECAQLSLVYCSVHETCEERFLLCRLLITILPWQNKKKTPLGSHFQCTFHSCVQKSSNQD